MDFLFRLPDGERLALWGEKGQIIRLLSTGNRSRTVIRSDYLSDLSAVMVEGKIYFVYQNASGAVMLHLPDEEEDILLMAERLENCRFTGLMLSVWQRKLYLFYFAWNAVRGANLLKMREVFAFGADDTTKAGFPTEREGTVAEAEVWEERENAPAFEVSASGDRLTVRVGEIELLCTLTSEGTYRWERGSRITEGEKTELLARYGVSEARCKEMEERYNEVKVRCGEAEVRCVSAEEKICELEALCREIEKSSEALRRERDEVIQRAELELYREREQVRELENRLVSAAEQYNELTKLAQRLQAEGKKWRDRYLSETKKKRERSGAVKVRRIIDADGQNT